MPQPPSSIHAAVGLRHVELGRRLGEREVRRAEAAWCESLAEERLHERLDGAGQVGERDAPVDDQALDLVEHRQVGGVGGVLAERAARATT